MYLKYVTNTPSQPIVLCFLLFFNVALICHSSSVFFPVGWEGETDQSSQQIGQNTELILPSDAKRVKFWETKLLKEQKKKKNPLKTKAEQILPSRVLP